MTRFLQAEKDRQAKALAAEELALFCLGSRGQHFEPDEWERRKAALAENPRAYLSGETVPAEEE